jgi:hypothetical protein
MNLDETIKNYYPEITDHDFFLTIILQDDSDGQGAYIAEWNYPKPIPEGLKLGK